MQAVPDEAFARANVLQAGRRVGDADGADRGRRRTRPPRSPDCRQLLDACGVEDDAIVAAPDDDRGAQRLFDLREAVPAGVNALVAAAKARAHPDIEKTAGDMVVPFSRLAESIALYRHGVREPRPRLCDLGTRLRRQPAPERRSAHASRT